MSLSPARQHRLRVQAEQAALEGGSVRHASGYELMLLQLTEDRRRLKGVQSNAKKAEIKAEVLPKYAAWVDGILSADSLNQDDVVMYVMLWRIDAGDYAGALTIGRHALKHGWVMPQGFSRNVQTLDAVNGQDMPDQSRARLHKSTGWVLTENEPELALNHLKQALQLDEKCGVKKDIEQLERKLRKDS